MQLFSKHAGSAGTFYCYTLLDKTGARAYAIMANSGTEQTRQAILQLSKYMQAKCASQ